MYILDTCVLLWMASEQDSLTEKVKQTLSENAGNLFISSISAFEIAIKSEKGKIELPLPPVEWVREALFLHGIEEIFVNSDIASKSVLLPKIHNDPCDRIVIATAMKHHMIIITRDKTIQQYPNIEIVWH
jgi:PIN domain nuclease of toxin-antitoxin system